MDLSFKSKPPIFIFIIPHFVQNAHTNVMFYDIIKLSNKKEGAKMKLIHTCAYVKENDIYTEPCDFTERVEDMFDYEEVVLLKQVYNELGFISMYGQQTITLYPTKGYI